jgi:hypothetical protein
MRLVDLFIRGGVVRIEWEDYTFSGFMFSSDLDDSARGSRLVEACMQHVTHRPPKKGSHACVMSSTTVDAVP